MRCAGTVGKEIRIPKVVELNTINIVAGQKFFHEGKERGSHRVVSIVHLRANENDLWILHDETRRRARMLVVHPEGGNELKRVTAAAINHDFNRNPPRLDHVEILQPF